MTKKHITFQKAIFVSISMHHSLFGTAIAVAECTGGTFNITTLMIVSLTVYRDSPMPYAGGWVDMPMKYVLK